MADSYMKEIECFQKDYDKLYAKGAWNKDEIAMMKDLKKLIYYNLVIDAMENGGEYPGSEYMPETSYARGRNPMNGQYVSRDMMRGSGNRYYPRMNSGMYYDDGMMSNGYSGRRYYDDEKKNALHKLHHMMDVEENPEKKNALKIAINELEEQK